MKPLRTAAALAAFLWSAVALAQSSGNLYLSQGKVFYQGLEFEKCVQRMDQASLWKKNTQKDLVEIELYSGLCKFSVGARAEADDHFALALQMDPTLQLPASTSPRIAEAFNAVAAKVRPAALARAEAARAQEQKEASTPSGPRRVELVPAPKMEPPAMQLVARKGPSRVVPLVLGGTSVVAAVAGGILGNMAKGHMAQHNDRATFYSDAQRLGDQARNEALGANVGFALAAATAVGAVTTFLLGM